MTLNGCANDNQCPLGAVCHKDPTVDQVRILTPDKDLGQVVDPKATDADPVVAGGRGEGVAAHLSHLVEAVSLLQLERGSPVVRDVVKLAVGAA